MARYGPLWQFPAQKTAAGTDCGTQPARGAGTAGVGQSVGLWLGIFPRRVPSAPAELSLVNPINTTAPAQPEIRSESRGCFVAQEIIGQEPDSPGECRPSPGRVPPVTPINSPAPAQPEHAGRNRGYGDWVMPWERRSRLQ